MYPAKNHVFASHPEREVLGQKLELARLEKGLSQMDVMELAGLIKEIAPGKYTGVTKGFFYYIEKGARGITKEQLTKVSKVLGVSMAYLLSGEPLERGKLAALTKRRNNAQLRRKTKPKAAAVLKAAKPKVVKTTKIKAASKVVPAKVKPTRVGQPRASRIPTEQFIPTPLFSKGDLAILAVVKGYTDDDKLWLADALKKLVEKAQTQLHHTA